MASSKCPLPPCAQPRCSEGDQLSEVLPGPEFLFGSSICRQRRCPSCLPAAKCTDIARRCAFLKCPVGFERFAFFCVFFCSNTHDKVSSGPESSHRWQNAEEMSVFELLWLPPLPLMPTAVQGTLPRAPMRCSQLLVFLPFFFFLKRHICRSRRSHCHTQG